MATWYIKDDLPYQITFPEMIKFTDYPKSSWVMYDDIPTKDTYPEMIKFTDTPKSTWIISNDLPYKQSYPNMIKFTGTPKGIWSIQKTDDDFYNIPYKSSFEKVSRPRRLHKSKYVDYEVIMDSNYEDDVRISMIYIQPIVLESYECNIVTEEL